MKIEQETVAVSFNAPICKKIVSMLYFKEEENHTLQVRKIFQNEGKQYQSVDSQLTFLKRSNSFLTYCAKRKLIKATAIVWLENLHRIVEVNAFIF